MYQSITLNADRVYCSTLTAFLMVMGALCLETSHGATYYVRTDGNDSNAGTGSSASQAWATISKGIGASSPVGAGDTVYIMSGTYIELVNIDNQAGAVGSPIRVIGDTDGAIFGGSGGAVIHQGTTGKAIEGVHAQYMHFEGIDFYGAGTERLVDLSQAVDLSFDKCKFYDGVGYGISQTLGSITVTNCLFRDITVSCVIVSFSGANAIFSNCTFVNSTRGFLQSGGTLTVTNCIIANHSHYGCHILSSSIFNHSYNLLYNNASGDFNGSSASTGEIFVDPEFVGGGDYSLQDTSPAIDVGTDLSGTVSEDLNGNTRPSGAGWDMGAYEYAAVAGSNLIGHWKLDETSGTTASDSSASGHNGTYTNDPVLGGTGIYGYAASFDGSDDHVTVSGGSTYNLRQSLTVSCWAKSDTPTWDGSGCLISKREQFILHPNDNTTSLFMSVDFGGGSFITTSYDMANLGSIQDWHHYVGVYDYDTGVLKLYVDGVLRATSSTTPNQLLNSDTGVLSIGRDDGWTDSTRHFDGQIDDVRLYNRVINDAEVIQLYGLKGHWKLDETSGTVAEDSSGVGNHGTYVNGPTLGAAGVRQTAITLNDSDTDDRIDLPNTVLDQSTAVGIAWWMKTTNTGETSVISGANNSIHNELLIIFTSSGILRPIIGNSFIDSLIPSISDGRWHHFVYQRDLVNGVEQFYMDGKLTINRIRSSSSNTIDIDPNGLVVGQDQDTVGGSFDPTEALFGDIDDLWIFDRILTGQEIAEIYGLVGHWKFDEGSGTTAADSTFFGNDATLNLATWTSDCNGVIGLEFDGTAGIAQTGSNFTPPSVGAVAFWVRGAGTPAARQRLFGIGPNWEVRMETTGTLGFDMGASPFVGNEPFSTTGDNELDREDSWHHVVAFFDATDDSYAVYVDGVLDTSGISPVDLVTQAAGILTFGTRTGSTEYWKGALRDFRIYNRPLADSEITELSGVIARWKLDETSGSIAVDASTAGNDATYIGSPTLGLPGAFAPNTITGVKLDGTTQSITASKSLLNNLTQFTLAGWLRPDSTTPDRSFFGQNDLVEVGIDFLANQIDLWTDAGGSVNANVFLPLGKWSHLAAVGDGIGLKLYVNGVEVASGGAATANYGSNTYLFKIGEGVLDPTGDYYDGSLDDVRVYSRALCPDDVRALYKGGRPAGIRIIRWVEVR